MFLGIPKNSQENTCVRVSFLIKLQASVQVFSCEFYEISKDTFFTEHLRWLLLSVRITSNGQLFPYHALSTSPPNKKNFFLNLLKSKLVFLPEVLLLFNNILFLQIGSLCNNFIQNSYYNLKLH